MKAHFLAAILAAAALTANVSDPFSAGASVASTGDNAFIGDATNLSPAPTNVGLN